MSFPFAAAQLKPAGLCHDLPRPVDEMELVGGDPGSRTLEYRDPETGQIYTVPNVPGNQQGATVASLLPGAELKCVLGSGDSVDGPSNDEYMMYF